MNEIRGKRTLAENVIEYEIAAPSIVRNARPGQFVILIVDEGGERVPFTIADFSAEKGTVTVLVQTVGYSTMALSQKNVGDSIFAIVGPLGTPTDLSGYSNILLVAGGIGSAVIFPQAKALFQRGTAADVVLGARNASLIFYGEEFRRVANAVHIATNDGSMGVKGFVTDVIGSLVQKKRYDAVFAVGPLAMMRAVCELTRPLGIKTVVSMNSMMVDGTGMCGCCRVTVDGKVRYACVDGPEFDGHLVDFDEAISRAAFYAEQERAHVCRLKGV